MDTKKYQIYCSPDAIEKAKVHIAKRNSTSTKGLRLGLRGGGCAGYSIVFEFADQIFEKDHIFVFDGVSFFIDPKSMIYLDGATIAYETNMMSSGFKFIIPKQVGGCGCSGSIGF